MLATAYLGLVFFILFIEIAREKTSKIDFLTFFNIAFSLLYPIPAFFLEANFDNSNTTMMFGSATYKSSMTTALAIFAGYFIVIIGFYSSSAKKFASTIQLHTRKNKVAIGYAIILLLISCVSIHVYSSQYGNLVDALSQSILIRSNAVDSGSFVFVKHFILTSFFGSYVLASFSLSIGKINLSKKILIRNLFFISVLISLTAAILHAGRTNFAYYIASFYCAYVVQGKKVPLTFVIPSLCLVIFLVLYGKQFFFSLSGIADGLDAVTAKFSETTDDPAGDSNFSFYDFIANFVYPVHSLSAALDTEYEWRLFVDWFYGIIGFLPEKVFNIQIPKQLSEYNTAYLVGNVDYDIPPGLLAYSIYSMSWFGLVINCFMYGWIGRYLQTVLNKYIHTILWMPFLYVTTAQVWIDFQVSGSPGVYMQTNFWYWISVFLLLSIVVKVSITPSKRHQISTNKSFGG